MSRITYIYHSGFAVETDTSVLILDLYKDPACAVQRLYKSEKDVYIVASHRHPDHFSPEIFSLHDKFLRPPTFILSADIRKALRGKQCPDQTVFLHSEEQYAPERSSVRFSAFPSTDIGISVCAEIDGLSIFHAGDLNLWQWKGESTEKEIKMASGEFRACLRSIRKRFDRFDIAMFPVDPRQGDGYEDGARIFAHEFQIGHFFPMHFWDKPEKAANFDIYKNPLFGFYHALTEPGDSITI